MTPLTLAEVAELEQARAAYVREVLTSTELTPEASKIARSYRAQLDAALPALLAAAKRLVELESALEYLHNHLDVAAPYRSEWVMKEAAEYGWTPPSEAK